MDSPDVRASSGPENERSLQKTSFTGFHRLKYPVIIVFFLILILSSISGAILQYQIPQKAYARTSLHCELCGKTIRGQYWKIGKRVFCNKCYRALPHCSYCNVPMKKYHTLDNRKFCPTCYFNRLSRCNRCNTPVFRYWLRDGKKYCKKCLREIVAKCSLCGKPLLGKYWIILGRTTGEEKKFCDSCKRSAKKCFVCGLPVASSSAPLSDGRNICGECRRYALRNQHQYNIVLNDVKKRFKQLGLTVNHKPKLNIVNKEQLTRIQESDSSTGVIKTGDKMGYYRCTKIHRRNRYGRKSTSILNADIYVLDNLPRSMAFRIVAHELAHAWHEERIDKHKDLIVMEGFAEWVTYHLLMKKGLHHIAETMKHRKDIYGRGLLHILKIEKKRGFNGVLRYVTR